MILGLLWLESGSWTRISTRTGLDEFLGESYLVLLTFTSFFLNCPENNETNSIWTLSLRNTLRSILPVWSL